MGVFAHFPNIKGENGWLPRWGWELWTTLILWGRKYFFPKIKHWLTTQNTQYWSSLENLENWSKICPFCPIYLLSAPSIWIILCSIVPWIFLHWLDLGCLMYPVKVHFLIDFTRISFPHCSLGVCVCFSFLFPFQIHESGKVVFFFTDPIFFGTIKKHNRWNFTNS